MLAFQPISAQEEEFPPVIVDTVWNQNNDEHLLPLDSILKHDIETRNTHYPKKIDPKFREKYQGDDFNYTTVKPKESLFAKIYRQIQKILESIFGEMDPLKADRITSTIFRILAILLGATVLYFLIRFLMSKDGNFFFGKKNKKLNIQSGDLHENIHEINFPSSILEFERNKDYRSAIRYHFLYLLKKLSDKKLIQWNPEKTNRDYSHELKDSRLKAQYEKLAYIFDNVWYGEFKVNETEYHHFADQFQKSGF